jgi:glycosyltransferase involved in cell wall biosynthesis
MGSGALIAAHRNPFNECVLGGDGFYFSDPNSVAELIQFTSAGDYSALRKKHQQKIREEYNWEQVIDQYESYILENCSV